METSYQPKALTPGELENLSQDIKQALTQLYGDRLDRVILYGSYARGDFHAESDVDYMVVLRDKSVQAGREVRRMSPLMGPMALKYTIEVSIFPVAIDKYEAGYTLFYQAVHQEGMTI